MAEYRKATRDEKAEIVDFINMVFSMAKVPHNFKTLLPKVYADDACAWAEHYIARAGGRLEGVTAMLEEEWSVLGERLPIGVVGSVSTHPYARGAGHMKECMRMLLEDARRKGLALLYLGGRRQRYEYFGFTQGGIGTRFHLDAGNVRHAWREVDPTDVDFADFAPWAERAAALYDGQPVRALRKAEDFAQIASSWSARPWAIPRGGAFAGYMVASGEGDDITELCLEDEADCAAVLKAWYVRQGRRTLAVDAPVWRRDRVRMLSRVAQDIEQGPVEMFRVLDFERVIRLFLTLKSRYARLAEGRFTLRVEDEAPLTVAVEGGTVRVEKTDGAPDIRMSRLEAQDLLLASMRWVDTSALPACVESWFPLPITVFSADGF